MKENFMRRVIVVFSMICLVFCSVPCIALAAGSYLGLKLNKFTPNSGDYDGFDSAIGFEIDFGNRISPNSAIEIGLLYQAPEGDFYIYDDFYGMGMVAEATVTTIGIPFTFKGIMPLADNKFDIFLGVGCGLYYSKLEMDVDVEYQGWKDSVSDSINGYGYGFHLVGGADVNVTPNLAVGGEIKWDYQYTLFDEDQVNDSFNLGGLTFSLTAKYKF